MSSVRLLLVAVLLAASCVDGESEAEPAATMEAPTTAVASTVGLNWLRGRSSSIPSEVSNRYR
jgi:hypothetical protein